MKALVLLALVGPSLSAATSPLASRASTAEPSVPTGPSAGDPLPVREAFPQGAPILDFWRGHGGKRLYTAVIALGGPGVIEVRAWDVEGEKQIWKAPLELRATVWGAGESWVYLAYDDAMSFVGRLEAGSGAKATALGPALTATAMVCAPDDKRVWVGTAEILDDAVEAGAAVVRTEQGGWSPFSVSNGGVTCLALDEKGKVLAIGGEDGTIRFAKAKSAKLEKKMIAEGHTGPVTALAFTAKGKVLVSGSKDGTVRTWSSSGKKKRVIDAPSPGGPGVAAIACEPKGKWVAAAYEDGVVRVWSLENGDAIAVLDDEPIHAQAGIEVIDGGKTLVAAGRESLRLWDLSGL